MEAKATADRGDEQRLATGTAANRRLAFLGYGACCAAGCLWGTGFYFGRLALDEMSVSHMVLYRFLFASVGILPVALVHWSDFRFTASEHRLLLLCAFLGVPLQFLLQFHGLVLTTVSHASLMVGAMPVLLAAAAAVFSPRGSREERLDLLGWLALSGSTAGAALVALGGGGESTAQSRSMLTGDLMVLVSLCAALAWILLSKKLMQAHSPLVVTAYTLLSGTAMLAAWVLIPWLLSPLTHAHVPALPFAHVSRTAWMALAASGLLCTASTTLLWNWGIHHVPAARAGVFLNIEPVLGAWLGVRLLGERLGPYAWIGGCLILAAAVALTTHAHEPEPAIILE
ncbi:MAG: DMT family transporter [Terracidiphilus sp.]